MLPSTGDQSLEQPHGPPTTGADLAARWRAELPALNLTERLERIRKDASGRIVFTTSFGLEDQFLTHHLASRNMLVELATLDTGRLFPETLELWAETEERYGVFIRPFTPEAGATEKLLREQGPLGFRQSVEARKSCCHIRKIAPLKRALAGAEVWITGLRGDQSANRAAMGMAEWDEAHGLIKVNPLMDFSRDEIAAEVARLAIPVNSLHASGFVSIGCAPCTRAIRPGEPERAGRWWWEDEGGKECGLHADSSGTLKRIAKQSVMT